MALVSINWKPKPKELIKFGLVVMIFFGAVGAILHFAYDQPTKALYVYLVGAVIGLPGLTGTKIAMPGYWLWMGFAFVMGNIISRILLAIIYYLVFTPMGLVMRLIGRDALLLKKKPRDSYWQKVQILNATSPELYERQF